MNCLFSLCLTFKTNKMVAITLSIIVQKKDEKTRNIEKNKQPIK